jgi:menaquinone-9 beta-reductase
VPSRFDVLVVGGGPAGSIAALVLARGGARVALVDKAKFPRDKACGDIVGPRALRLLADLEMRAPTGRNVGEMMVVGPNGRRAQLPCGEGLTYPGHGTAVTRTVFDSMLHQVATEAGATPVYGHAVGPLECEGRIDGYRLSDGTELRADFVIGADGATSRVAGAAGMVDAKKVLWGFAIRTYLPQAVDLPAIVLWESAPWHGFPGYGWVFPGATGEANVGLGLGTVADRKAGAKVQQALPRFLEHLREVELLTDASLSMPSRRLGGWLKMGMVGTVPAEGRVLLVGDAAGLVNPLQGEGISQAMCSGRSAAAVVLAEPGQAAERYRSRLAIDHLPYHRITAAVQGWLVGRPRAVAAVSRLAMTAGRIDALSGGWSVFWNELLDGAPPGRHRSVAATASRLGEMMTARTATAQWFDTTFADERIPLMCQEVDLCSTGSDSRSAGASQCRNPNLR